MDDVRGKKPFFELLRSGLWEREVIDRSLFPLSEEEWKQVYVESRRQTVQGLLYKGFQYLPEEWFPPQDVLFKWLADVNAIEEANRTMSQAVTDTARLLREIGVEPVLMKGHAVAQLYEHPEWRSCGDIDWYLPDGMNLQQTSNYLQSLGYTPEPAPDGSLHFLYGETDVELHWQLIDILHPGKEKVIQTLQQTDSFTSCQLDDGNTVCVPSPLQSLLMLHAHLMKHAFTVGVGMRQFCDLARAYHVWKGQYDKPTLLSYMKQLGMEKWGRDVDTLLVDYLGVPADDVPDYEGTDSTRKHSQRLLRAVMEWGNFGQHTKHWRAAHSKQYTIGQILRNTPLSMRYAPMEMIYKVKNLMIGQRKYKQI